MLWKRAMTRWVARFGLFRSIWRDRSQRARLSGAQYVRSGQWIGRDFGHDFGIKAVALCRRCVCVCGDAFHLRGIESTLAQSEPECHGRLDGLTRAHPS